MFDCGEIKVVENYVKSKKSRENRRWMEKRSRKEEL